MAYGYKANGERDLRGLTRPQFVALQKLANATTFATTKHGNIATGVNTHVLYNLRQQGFITCTTIYIGGIVTADFVVTDAGRAAAIETTK